MSKKTTKRALAMSFVSVFLCVCMLVGTTFAWFTDSASTAVNKIQSGTLDIVLEYESAPDVWTDAKNQTLEFKKAANAPQGEAILWEPGCTYELPAIRVRNNGNLALKYEIVINGVNGDAKLLEAINWTANDAAISTISGALLTKDATSTPIVIKGHMKEDAGNEYQGLEISGIGVTVQATQKDAEFDSFNNQYDANAKFDVSVWDGTTVTAPVADANGVYRISTAAELVGMMNDSKYPNCNNYQNVVLENNIDLAGRTVSGFGDDSGFFDGIFDGQGYTISNFKIDATNRTYYAGLFNQVSQYSGTNTVIKNLTVANATIKGTSQVGAIVGGMNGNTVVENCKVINCDLYAVKKVGAVVGYTAGGTVKDCYAENCTVLYSEKEGNEILGYENTGSTVNGNTFNNVTVAKSATVSNNSQLANAIADGASTVVLGSGNYIIPDSAQGKTLTIVGNGDTVVANQNDGSYEGCDYSLDGATVTFEGVTINTDGHTYAGYARCSATYNNCTINGSYTLYGESVFNNCTFNVTGDYYNIWTWGAKNVKFNDCTFNTDGKSILVYNQTCDVYVDGCTFNDRTNGTGFTKSAFETGVDGVGPKYNIYINDTTVNGFAENDKCVGYKNIVGNKNSMTNEYLNIVIDGVDVY